QAAAASEVRERINRGQSVTCCKRDDQMAMSRQRRSPNNDQTTIRHLRERHDGALDLARIAHIHRTQLHAQRLRHSLDDCVLTGLGTHSGVPKDRCSRHTGRDFFEQLEPFSAEDVLVQGKSSDVAARCAKLSTKPAPTGSMILTNTTGTVRVVCWSAPIAALAEARMTSGASATSSAAYRRLMRACP